jgi:hypothetical protein
MQVGGFSYPLWAASAVPLAAFALGALSCKVLGKWTWVLIILGVIAVIVLKAEGV